MPGARVRRAHAPLQAHPSKESKQGGCWGLIHSRGMESGTGGSWEGSQPYHILHLALHQHSQVQAIASQAVLPPLFPGGPNTEVSFQ